MVGGETPARAMLNNGRLRGEVWSSCWADGGGGAAGCCSIGVSGCFVSCVRSEAAHPTICCFYCGSVVNLKLFKRFQAALIAY
ncbi:hypothetical protein GCWU000324_03131 [Kingella oralis ATCC 51147]|uniref:Uncharacterized protein n=1 Tax=Kingella oralis ATCC 51147 TaxID=629741 RepID=C4GN42_9NEIS|nr:hypothetical protein GCWU000324_03131 [Kingella oralis ATCC 51147]